MKLIIVQFIFLLCFSSSIIGQNSIHRNGAAQEECTIGVAIGDVTTDGRPLLWKTRDYTSEPNNIVKYFTSFQYKFINISTSGSSNLARMGLNEHGFAIVNSSSNDLPLGISEICNGTLMQLALGNCKTIADFQSLLDSTNITGRRTQGNMGVIDSTGAAAIFEIADTVYWRFNAADTHKGYLIRTNFTINGGSTSGIERFNRSSDLINSFCSGDSLNYKNIIRYHFRDFSDKESKPIIIPYPNYWSPVTQYGYINCEKSICRYSTVSAAVIHGVLPTEIGSLSTMWTILGHPAASVAVPYWAVGETPLEANGTITSSLCNIAIDIKAQLFDYISDPKYIDTYKLLNNTNGGLWACTFSLENYLFSETETFMESIRTENILPVNSILAHESYLANHVLNELQNCYKSQIIDNSKFATDRILAIYPNPFIDKTQIVYLLEQVSCVKIEIFSYMGQKIETVLHETQSAGKQLQLFYVDKNKYPDGIYFVKIFINNKIDTYKIIKLSN